MSSFVEKFKIPYTESLTWDSTIGIHEMGRLGLCGNIIADRGNEYNRRLNSLKNNLNRVTQSEIDWLLEEVHSKQQFTASVCMKEKGHSGPCSKSPYIPKAFEGEVLKGPWVHEGADKNCLQNRGGSRNGLIQFSKEIVKSIRQQNKDIGIKPENCNLGINLNKGASKYMCGLAHLDMISIAFNIKDAKKLFDTVPDDFKSIMDLRWQELKKYYYNQKIKIFDENDNYQDPFKCETVKISQFGTKEELLERMQFGHVTPVNENRYETRPFNVLPITRWANLMQSSASVSETMKVIQEMGDKYRKEFGNL